MTDGVTIYDVAPPEGVTTYDVEPPSFGEVLKSAGQQPGLSFIAGTGGALRALGDLTRSRTLEDLGAELYKNASGAAQDITPAGMSLGQQVGFGAVQSVGEQLPFLAAAALSGGTAALPILGAAGTTATQRYGELRQENFSGGISALGAGVDGFAEALGEKIALPVLFGKSAKPLLAKFSEFVSKELAGEELTTVMQQANAMLLDKPNMTWGQFLDGMKMTALTVPVTAGIQAPLVHTLQMVRGGQQVQPADTAPPVTPPVTPPVVAPVVTPTQEVTTPPVTTPQQDVTLFELTSPTTVDIPAPKEVERPFVDNRTQELFQAQHTVDTIQDSPSDMITKGQVDPTLYDGMLTADQQSVLKVLFSPISGYTIDKQSTIQPGIQEIEYAFDTPQANDRLAQLAGTDLRTNPDEMKARHMTSLLQSVQRGDGDLISNSNFQYYGDQLKELIQQYKDQPATLGKPATPLLGQYRNAIAQYNAVGRTLGYDALINGPTVGHIYDLKGNQIQEQRFDQMGSVNAGPSTMIMMPNQYESNAKRIAVAKSMKGLAARVEVWRSQFMPGAKILLAPHINLQNINGQMLRMADGTYIIGMNENNFKNTGLTYVTAAHEFGHALIFDQLMKSDPHTVLKFMNEWMQVRSDWIQNTPDSNALNAVRYGGVHRVTNLRDTTANPSNGWSLYQLGFDEYMADQVSQFLYEDNSIFSPEQKGVLQRVADKLKEFFNSYNTKFLKLDGFDTFMNNLRGGKKTHTDPQVDQPTDVAQPKRRTSNKNPTPGPVITLTNIQDLLRTPLPIVHEDTLDFTHQPVEQGGADAPLTPENRLAEKQQREADRRREAAVRRELTKYGLDKSDLWQFEQADGSLDFNDAFQFLEENGVDTSKFGDSTIREDDTTILRGQIASIGLHFKDLQEHIPKTNEAIKNFNWFFQKTLTAVQVRKLYGAVVPGIKQFVDKLEQMHAYRSRWKAGADDRLGDMRNISRKERNAVFRFLFEEDALGQYISKAQKNADGSYTRVIDKADATQRGITERGAQLYADISKDFKKALDELEELAVRELNRNYKAGPEITPERQMQLEKAVLDLQKEFAQMRAKPYVPHTRFGDWTVTVLEDGKVSEFYQFESKRDAQMHANQLREQGKTAGMGKMRDELKAFIGLPPTLISAMKQNLNLNADQIKEFEELIKNLSSGQSFVRRMKERKNIAGYKNEDEQFPRVYADYFSRFANHAARLNFNHQLNDAVGVVRQQVRDGLTNAEDTASLSSLINWMQKTHDWSLNPRSDFANTRAAVTLWYLGFSVKSALVNAGSVPMVTLPYLSSRFGSIRATAEIGAAYRDLARKFKNDKALTDDEKKVLANLREMGVLDESLSSELAGIREGGSLSELTQLEGLAASAYKVKTYGMWMFHKVELVNRYSTALAAYRLAREQVSFNENDLDGFDKKARDFAKLTVQDTQNENAQWNRAELMRGGKSVFTMFMSYQQNVIFQMFGGDSSWMRLLAVQLTLAGIMGLPFAKDLDSLTKWFARKVIGSDDSIDKAVREYLSNTLINPDWVLNGASYNVFGGNLQGSLSMGGIIPGLDALAMEGDFPTRLANAAGDVGGAGSAVVLDFMKAMADNNPNAILRFQGTLPQAVKNAMQGVNMMTTGKAKDGRGDTVAEVSTADSLMKTMGVQPTAVSRESTLRFVEKDTARYWLTRKQYVLAKFQNAYQQGDADLMDEARNSLYKYNEDVPSGTLRIDAKSVRESLKSHAKQSQLAELGLPGSKSQFDLMNQVRDRYQ